MRNIPVDASKVRLLASGKLSPKPAYAELADGSRKRIPGEQAIDKNKFGEGTGLPLWVVDCYLDDDEEDGRAEVVGVTVTAVDRPSVTKFAPVNFTDLVATGYVRDGRVSYSFKASGVVPAPARKGQAA
jgi:hypothetical protein